MDISGCGFIKLPTITTSIEGRSEHEKATGNSAVLQATTKSFRMGMFTNGWDPRRDKTKSRQWNVEWIAVGYIC